ncbi:F-box/LRR-repeat protein 17-like [Styela clava]
MDIISLITDDKFNYYFYRVGSKLSDDVFIAFAENCPRLKKFVLECLEITDKTVLSIAHNLHDLEHLSVSQISNISNEAVAEVIKCCRKLKLLKISHNKQITEKCLVTIPESSLSIQTLDFLMCNFNPNGIAILGELLNLEDINLSKCEDLTTDDLMPIMEGCKNLKAISLNLNKKFDDNFIDIILTKLPNMEKFYLVSTTITDEALVIMGKKGKKISVIDIGYTKVTGFGARYVSENCACLEYLGLIRCDSVPEEEVEKLVVEYPHIMYSTFIQDTKRMFAKIERDGRLD